jgi:uncharacterized membrane protein SirB2
MTRSDMVELSAFPDFYSMRRVKEIANNLRHRAIIRRPNCSGVKMAFLSEHYVLIRQMHVVTAVLSVTLFTLRFLFLMGRSARLQKRWLKVLPHLNDSVLLVLATLLCVSIQQAPLITPWLTEKVSAVILYILAGMFALKWSKSRLNQIIWFIIAIIMFAYTANIAINKTPLLL